MQLQGPVEPATKDEVATVDADAVAGTGGSPDEMPAAGEVATEERSVAAAPSPTTETSQTTASTNGATRGEDSEYGRVSTPQIEVNGVDHERKALWSRGAVNMTPIYTLFPACMTTV